MPICLNHNQWYTATCPYCMPKVVTSGSTANVVAQPNQEVEDE